MCSRNVEECYFFIWSNLNLDLRLIKPMIQLTSKNCQSLSHKLLLIMTNTQLFVQFILKNIAIIRFIEKWERRKRMSLPCTNFSELNLNFLDSAFFLVDVVVVVVVGFVSLVSVGRKKMISSVVNFTNIIWAVFAPISWRLQKTYKMLLKKYWLK